MVYPTTWYIELYYKALQRHCEPAEDQQKSTLQGVAGLQLSAACMPPHSQTILTHHP